LSRAHRQSQNLQVPPAAPDVSPVHRYLYAGMVRVIGDPPATHIARAIVTLRRLCSSSETAMKTRVFGDLRSRVTCVDQAEHSAQRVSTHSPWVVGSSPTRPTTSLLPAQSEIKNRERFHTALAQRSAFCLQQNQGKLRPWSEPTPYPRRSSSGPGPRRGTAVTMNRIYPIRWPSQLINAPKLSAGCCSQRSRTRWASSSIFSRAGSFG